MFVALTATHISLIDLNGPFRHPVIAPASLPQSTEHKPRCRLPNAQFLGQLEGRDALARRHDEVHGIHPLVERDMGAFEDGAGANGELVAAIPAAVVALAFPAANGDFAVASAQRTYHITIPAQLFKVGLRRFFVREHLKELEGADGEVVLHGRFQLNCTQLTPPIW